MPHGFRSTFRDWAGETRAEGREVVEAALAHSIKDKAEAAYARSDLLEKRRPLMDAWAEQCTSASGSGAAGWARHAAAKIGERPDKHDPGGRNGLIWHQVRSVFFVTLIPRALSHFLCSACALVSAAVLGRLACLGLARTS